MIDVSAFTQLRGTSTEKVAALLATVRADGKASLALGLMERAPYVGPTVKFLLYDVPKLDPADLDAMLDRVVDAVRSVQSDTVTSPALPRRTQHDVDDLRDALTED